MELYDILIAAVAGYAGWRLGRWYQTHHTMVNILNDPERWEKVVHQLKIERENIERTHPGLFDKEEADPDNLEKIVVEQHGSQYYLFTIKDKFLGQGNDLKELLGTLDPKQYDIVNLVEKSEQAHQI